MNLRQWFADLPIPNKLTLITVVTVLAAFIPVLGITLTYEFHTVYRSSMTEAEVQADIIRDNVAAATAFADGKAAAEILQALHSSPSVIQAAVFLPNNAALARYVKTGESPVPLVGGDPADATTEVAGGIRIGRIVRLKQDTVGWVAIQTSTAPLRERIGFYVVVNLLSALLGFAVAQPISRSLRQSITGPLSDLIALAHHVKTHHDYSPAGMPNRNADEIGELSRAFDSMLTGIRRRDLKLSQMAYYDPVTGLANRHYFSERIALAIANSLKYGKRCCVMFIDLDNFKAVNDTHGHHAGDELLRDVSKHLTAVTRANDFVCRLGGDEFAIIVEDIKDLSGPTVLAQKVIAELASPMRFHGSDLAVGASIGLAACPDHATDVAGLLHAADAAMYQAKERGKNCFCLFSPSTGPSA